MRLFTKKALAVFVAVLMVALTAIPAFAAEQVEYVITNPYETVDWDAWNTYKAQLHTHTLYSDGEMTITDVVEAYYALDYDILAITDHGVVQAYPEAVKAAGHSTHRTVQLKGTHILKNKQRPLFQLLVQIACQHCLAQHFLAAVHGDHLVAAL